MRKLFLIGILIFLLPFALSGAKIKTQGVGVFPSDSLSKTGGATGADSTSWLEVPEEMDSLVVYGKARGDDAGDATNIYVNVATDTTVSLGKILHISTTAVDPGNGTTNSRAQVLIAGYDYFQVVRSIGTNTGAASLMVWFAIFE